MSVLDDIAAALVTAELGQDTTESADWMIRVGYLQEAPDRSICIYFAGGAPPETAIPVGYPKVQVRVRGQANDFNAVQEKEAAIFAFLHAGNAQIQFGGDYVYCYAQQSAPMSLGQDENRRSNLARNYKLMRSPA
jgi:hypothetical protein